MPAVVVDTDVVSYLHKKDTRARLFRHHLLGKERIISFMTLAELELWVLERNWGVTARERPERHSLGYAVYFADTLLCVRWVIRSVTRLDSAEAPASAKGT
jgi:predicted nucleic acid-binding protein